MVRTANDEITIGTEHWRTDEWKSKGRVAGAKLKPDLVWLRREDGGQWKKVVVDVKITSTDKMNDSFRDKDEKYREWTTRETREKKVGKAVMVPLIISHDGAVHMDTVRRWKSFAPDVEVDWVRMAQSVLRYDVVIVGKFFNKGSWMSEAWRKEHPEEPTEEPDGPPERMPTIEERRQLLGLDPAGAVCAAFGHATSTRRSVDVRRKGNPEPTSTRTNQPT